MTEENQNVNGQGSEQGTTAESTNNNKNILKWAVILVTIFVVTFCAVYLVIKMNKNSIEAVPSVEEQAEKMMETAEKYIAKNEPVPLNIDEKTDKYIITIDLKPFDNDPNKIDIETQENGIKFSGHTEKKDNDQIQETSYYQALIFPRNINKEEISKEHKGDKFIITIPFAE